MAQSETRDLLVGLFLLAGFAALAYLSVSLGGTSYRGPGGLEIIATFDEVGGLKPRSPVVIGGVKVGQVKAITLDEDLRARVTLDIDPRRSKIIRTKLPVSRVSVTDPEILEVVQFSPTEFELIGGTTGQTSLTFWFAGMGNGGRLLRYLLPDTPWVLRFPTTAW